MKYSVSTCCENGWIFVTIINTETGDIIELKKWTETQYEDMNKREKEILEQNERFEIENRIQNKEKLKQKIATQDGKLTVEDVENILNIELGENND